MRLRCVISLLSLVAPSISTPYEQYILTPRTRTLQPVSVHSSNGSVSDPESLLGSSGNSVFDGVSATAYDFGINIAGVVTLTIGGVCGDNQTIGVTFSESSLWISNRSSDATADAGKDETLWFQIDGPGQYSAPAEKVRGGFRYMTLVHNTTGSVEVTAVEVYYTPMPHWEEEALGNYTGYFHCDDELLNRIWYAGAYTNEMCTISPSTGDALIHFGEITSAISDAINVTWYNNQTIANGTSVLVDGAKRDRLVWAGDMAIAVPGVVVSTNDVISIENSLNSLFDSQNTTTGQLPYAGRPLMSVFSFTYHLYSLIGVADHYLYTGDIIFLQSLWQRWKFAMDLPLSFIDSTGLANVTTPLDWLRFGMGGHNIEANAILYNTLNQGIALATALNDTASVSNWSSIAETIKTAANTLLWDEGLGMYTDNETTTLAPQDGNSWAVVANLTQNSSQIRSISSRLISRWTPYGAQAPEAGDTVSPFISGFELQAHMLASNASAALALMRLQWGFMLDDPRMTNSTFIEGYSTTGALHYTPYLNDARISHAHGWATGPTSSLTFYVAGIQLLSAGGATWRIAPKMGDLKEIDAGFSTKVGMFSVKISASEDGLEMTFETPQGTTGEIQVPTMDRAGRLELQEESRSVEAVMMNVTDTDAPIVISGLQGGKWKVTYTPE